MINEEQKHLADIFKIGGSALMSPLGKFVLDFSTLSLSSFTIWYFIGLLAALMFFCFGIIFLLKSIEKVEERKNNRWKKE